MDGIMKTGVVLLFGCGASFGFALTLFAQGTARLEMGICMVVIVASTLNIAWTFLGHGDWMLRMERSRARRGA